MRRRTRDYPTPLRIASTCPTCTAPLRLRRRREDKGLFLGCAEFPRCKFAEDFDLATAALYERIADLEAELAYAKPMAAGLDIGRELRGVIAIAHPDRWPGNALAHEVTARLIELRSRCAA